MCLSHSWSMPKRFQIEMPFALPPCDRAMLAVHFLSAVADFVITGSISASLQSVNNKSGLDIVLFLCLSNTRVCFHHPMEGRRLSWAICRVIRHRSYPCVFLAQSPSTKFAVCITTRRPSLYSSSIILLSSNTISDIAAVSTNSNRCRLTIPSWNWNGCLFQRNSTSCLFGQLPN